MPFLDIHIHKQEDKYVVNVTENKITMESFVSGLDIYFFFFFTTISQLLLNIIKNININYMWLLFADVTSTFLLLLAMSTQICFRLNCHNNVYEVT